MDWQEEFYMWKNGKVEQTKAKHLHDCWQWTAIGDALISIPSVANTYQILARLKALSPSFTYCYSLPHIITDYAYIIG